MLPKWVWNSALSILSFGTWGVVSKMAMNHISPWLNQVISTIGLVPVALVAVRSKGFNACTNKVRGVAFGFLTGLLGGTGNIAFYMALSHGGKASTVVPLTGLYPMMTVFAALIMLRERLNRVQVTGVALALLAIVLLNVS